MKTIDTKLTTFRSIMQKISGHTLTNEVVQELKPLLSRMEAMEHDLEQRLGFYGSSFEESGLRDGPERIKTLQKLEEIKTMLSEIGALLLMRTGSLSFK